MCRPELESFESLADNRVHERDNSPDEGITMTPENGYDLVRLTTAANSFQAHIWQQGLEREGIRCQVLGDYLYGGIGDIPGITAEVWVEPADLARAEAILRQHQDRSEVEESTDETQVQDEIGTT